MKTVLYVTNIPTPYRTAFFDLLSRKFRLTVAYERSSADNRDRSWSRNSGALPYQVLWLKGRSFKTEFSISFDLVRHLRRNRYDHVIFGGYNSPTVILAMRWMRRHHLPYGITVDGMLPKAGKEKAWKGRLKSSLISGADFWLSSGHITTEELVRYGARRERVFEIPFSSVHDEDIPDEPPEKSVFKHKLGCPEDTVLLYVGQFIHRKGIDLLLPAFSRFCAEEPGRNTVLYLVGGKEEQLRDLGCLPLPEHVRVVPFLTKKELSDYYKAADLFVLPTREDIWGLVVNEAMSYGIPVLTTDRCVAGLELIEPGVTGLLIPADNSAALANGLRDGLKLSDRDAVLTKARQYTIEKMTETTARVLEDL